MYMFDTNMCIYAIKNNSNKLQKKISKHNIEDICISVITYCELINGVYKSKNIEKNRLALFKFLSKITIKNYSINCCEHYAKIRSSLEKNGMPIGSLDYLIASHAIESNCILVTNNTKEFSRIKELQIENWAV